MNKEILKYIRIIFGVILIVVGIGGIVLPILPGWILIFFGIELLGIQIVFLDHIKQYVKEKVEQARKKK